MTEGTGVASGHARLGLLRDFELDYAGERVEVAYSSQRLICFLAFQGSRPVRRSFVSGSLWTDSTEAHAQASLRSALWRSPVCGGVSLVCANSTQLWLAPDVEVDLRTATARARQLLDLHASDPTSIDVMAEVDAFGHDVLIGWYDDWIEAERERFRQLRLHVLDQLGELLLRSHRYAEAVQIGLVALGSDALRESAHRLLVRAHLCDGNPAEAMRQYRCYADRLADELGVRPSAAMEELVGQAVSSTRVVARPHRGQVSRRGATA